MKLRSPEGSRSGIAASLAATVVLSACVALPDPQPEKTVPPQIAAAQEQILTAVEGVLVQPIAAYTIVAAQELTGMRPTS
mgnify:CR=1 FL=1